MLPSQKAAVPENGTWDAAGTKKGLGDTGPCATTPTAAPATVTAANSNTAPGWKQIGQGVAVDNQTPLLQYRPTILAVIY
jgi:hypothetical protein